MDGQPLVSPLHYESTDYQGAVIRITINFNNSTHVLQTSSVFRDANCVYTKIYIGLGADGTPNSTPKVFSVPAGTSSIGAQQLANNGLSTVEDVMALQITAGP